MNRIQIAVLAVAVVTAGLALKCSAEDTTAALSEAIAPVSAVPDTTVPADTAEPPEIVTVRGVVNVTIGEMGETKMVTMTLKDGSTMWVHHTDGEGKALAREGGKTVEAVGTVKAMILTVTGYRVVSPSAAKK